MDGHDLRPHRLDSAERVRTPDESRRPHRVRGRLRGHDRVLHRRRSRRGHGRRVGAQQPHAHRYEQLVPLREGVRGDRGMHRLHDAEVLLDENRPLPVVQVLPVRDRGHQHPDRGGQRLRERRARVRHHLGVHRRRRPLRRLAQRVQRHRGSAQHRLHDRLVRHLHLQEAPGHAVA